MLILVHTVYIIVVKYYLQVFVDKLPSSELFEKSYMHRDTVTHVVVTRSEFIVTASADGHVKFWKKEAGGIEFVKHFRAHLGKREKYLNDNQYLMVAFYFFQKNFRFPQLSRNAGYYYLLLFSGQINYTL